MSFSYGLVLEYISADGRPAKRTVQAPSIKVTVESDAVIVWAEQELTGELKVEMVVPTSRLIVLRPRGKFET